jgi:hypothetical protein
MVRLLPFLLLHLAFGLGACDLDGTVHQEPFKVAVATFSHETCTFCPGGDVTVEDWERVGLPVGGIRS